MFRKCHVLSMLKIPCNSLFWVVSGRPVTRLKFPPLSNPQFFKWQSKSPSLQSLDHSLHIDLLFVNFVSILNMHEIYDAGGQAKINQYSGSGLGSFDCTLSDLTKLFFKALKISVNLPIACSISLHCLRSLVWFLKKQIDKNVQQYMNKTNKISHGLMIQYI